MEKKNPRQELYKFLRNYRSTPHTSTGKSPAEALFGRQIKTRLPQFMKESEDEGMRKKDKESKANQKKYKDAKKTVQPHNIEVGDTVLLKRKQTKTTSRYDPSPFRVTDVKGTQITAAREHQVRTRDAQRFKKVTIAKPKSYQYQRQPLVVHPANNSSLGLLSMQPSLPTQARAQSAQIGPAANVLPGDLNHLGPNGQEPAVEEMAVAPENVQQQGPPAPRGRPRGRPRGSTRKKRGFAARPRVSRSGTHAVNSSNE